MSTTAPLQDTAALVTGGGTGIGLGCARRLATEGALVTICGRRADVLEAAGLVAFLAGPDSSWITGQFIGVDGGHSLRRGPNLDNLFGGLLDEPLDALFGGLGQTA